MMEFDELKKRICASDRTVGTSLIIATHLSALALIACEVFRTADNARLYMGVR